MLAVDKQGYSYVIIRAQLHIQSNIVGQILYCIVVGIMLIKLNCDISIFHNMETNI